MNDHLKIPSETDPILIAKRRMGRGRINKNESNPLHSPYSKRGAEG
jgi:hypothetical protein